jgi:hypothetical protein
MAAEVAEGTPTSQAVPAPPAGGGGGGSTQGSSAGGSGGSTQPSSGAPSSSGGDGDGANVTQPEAGATPDQRPPVPYSTFKRERANFNKRIRDLEARYQEAAAWEKKYGTLADEHRQLTERFGDYNALAAVIRANPELAEQISEAIRQSGGAAPTDGKPSYAQLPPDVMQAIKGMGQLVQQVEQGRALQAKQEEQRQLEATRKDVQARISKLLKAKQLDEKFLPQAEAYVLRRVNEMGEEAEMDDIPYLFAEWAGPLFDWHNQKLSALTAGKKSDSGMPVPPGSSPPVAAAAAKHGLDGEATKRGVEFLTSRGWAP